MVGVQFRGRRRVYRTSGKPLSSLDDIRVEARAHARFVGIKFDTIEEAFDTVAKEAASLLS